MPRWMYCGMKQKIFKLINMQTRLLPISKTNILLYVFLLIYTLGFAQYSFKKTDSLQVAINGKNLKLAWAGGFNYMQFSEIDLDYNGTNDLFTFDRSSNKIITFKNEGITDSVSYLYAPQFISNFPANMRDWVLLADYNCDGKQDIFTQNQGAIKIYINDGNANVGLHFSLVVDKLYSLYSSDFIPLYVSSVDIPSISDIDNDGDLDIVTFSVNGYYVEYHKNLSKENFGSCDSLKFVLSTSCWGDFKEDPSTCIINLNIPCFNLIQTHALIDEREIQHSGSALLALDLDGDTDKDILISDIGCSTLTAITNGGNSSLALGTQEDNTFPSYDTPVNMSIFPTPFYLDINNDGKKDLIASPNTTTASENKKCVLHYKNTGTTSNPHFKFRQNDFLVDDMIDNGEGAYPAFFDFNNDGLLDFVVGNIGRFTNSEIKGRLMLFKNIGASNYPKYALEDDDYLGLSANTNLSFLVSTFADLDADGDVDLIIGNNDGKLMYYNNIAGTGNVANFQLADAFYSGIDVGNNAAPQIIDVNRDGLLDIIVGNFIGKIRYYKNTGTAQTPIFTEITTFFGGVFTGIDYGVVLNDGYCVPQLFDIGGTYHLLCGSKSGRIYKYGNIDGNLSGTFSKLDTNYLNIWEGRNSALAIADINNDGQKDMLIGNICGGLNYYSGDITNSISKIEIESTKSRIFPNPASNILNVQSADNITEIVIIDAFGQILISKQNYKNTNAELPIQNLKPGIYYCKIKMYNNTEVLKFVVGNNN